MSTAAAAAHQQQTSVSSEGVGGVVGASGGAPGTSAAALMSSLNNSWDPQAFESRLSEMGSTDAWMETESKQNVTRLQDLSLGLSEIDKKTAAAAAATSNHNRQQQSWPYESSPCRMFGGKNTKKGGAEINQGLFKSEFGTKPSKELVEDDDDVDDDNDDHMETDSTYAEDETIDSNVKSFQGIHEVRGKSSSPLKSAVSQNKNHSKTKNDGGNNMLYAAAGNTSTDEEDDDDDDDDDEDEFASDAVEENSKRRGSVGTGSSRGSSPTKSNHTLKNHLPSQGRGSSPSKLQMSKRDADNRKAATDRRSLALQNNKQRSAAGANNTSTSTSGKGGPTTGRPTLQRRNSAANLVAVSNGGGGIVGRGGVGNAGNASAGTGSMRPTLQRRASATNVYYSDGGAEGLSGDGMSEGVTAALPRALRRSSTGTGRSSHLKRGTSSRALSQNGGSSNSAGAKATDKNRTESGFSSSLQDYKPQNHHTGMLAWNQIKSDSDHSLDVDMDDGRRDDDDDDDDEDDDNTDDDENENGSNSSSREPQRFVKGRRSLKRESSTTNHSLERAPSQRKLSADGDFTSSSGSASMDIDHQRQQQQNRKSINDDLSSSLHKRVEPSRQSGTSAKVSASPSPVHGIKSNEMPSSGGSGSNSTNNTVQRVAPSRRKSGDELAAATYHEGRSTGGMGNTARSSAVGGAGRTTRTGVPRTKSSDFGEMATRAPTGTTVRGSSGLTDELGAATLHGKSSISRIRKEPKEEKPTKKESRKRDPGNRRGNMTRAMSTDNVMLPENYGPQRNREKQQAQPQPSQGAIPPENSASTSPDETVQVSLNRRRGGKRPPAAGSETPPAPPKRDLMVLLKDQKSVTQNDLRDRENRSILHCILMEQKLGLNLRELSASVQQDMEQGYQAKPRPLYVDP